MAGLKFSEMTAAGALTGSEIVPIVQDGDSVRTTAQAIAELAGGGGEPGYTANALISGGGVAWVGDLDFIVSAASYSIAGVAYSSPQTPLTLSAADPDDPRIDVIAVNSSGAAVVIEGTPAGSPAAPDVDPATQLQLTFAYVDEDATEPTNVASNVLYKEDTGEPTEWTASKTGAPINLASTNNPYEGTKCIEATAAVSGNLFQLTDAAAFSTGTRNTLVFYIRSKATWPAAKSLSIRWYSSTNARGKAVSFTSGSFGFDSSNIADYQQIVIPLWLFEVAALSVDAVRFTVGGGGAAIGFYFDNLELQGGISSPASVSDDMTWRGAYSATTAYDANDVVTNAGATWIALVSSTGVTPVAGAYWAAVGGGGGGGGTMSAMIFGS